ncbi:jg13049 [Pararge aegeria aegeria]|uniref:Jg13049 protein n=1 Tax=Pararge aegeria aegeria TaxID=348720 RepID=A0A8S4QFD3_9NEOP|nr:jg13049 [Pararge aegeria aegeria]
MMTTDTLLDYRPLLTERFAHTDYREVRRVGQIKESELSSDSVLIGVSELWQGVEAFRPSVTEEELAYYESLQSQM